MMKLSKPRPTLRALLAATLLIAGCSKKTEETASTAATGAAALKAPAVVASPEGCKACLANTRCLELPECASFTGDERAACDAVEQCVQTSNCADGKNTFTTCFCGALKMSDCVAAPNSGPGAPAGACATVIRKSLGGDQPSNREILASFTKPKLPGGAAIARMNCSKFKGCGTECGF
jgi:hypothetical protein